MNEKIQRLLYPEDKNIQRLNAKTKAYLTNPLIRRDGSLANKYLDYQSLIDRPGTNQRLADKITEATGVTRTRAVGGYSAASGGESGEASSAAGSTSSAGFAASGSGGKATYNVRSFSASKAGADYVNKNSPFADYGITSYTGSRNTGIKGASTNHAGLDRAVPEGTKISVPINTTFYQSGSDSARGNWIELKDQNGNILHFQHLRSFATGYKQGDSLPAGTAFAVSGSTGVGRAHLHEEYYTPDGGTNITESYWNSYAPI
ncbi:MAG: M23 family metallopeptidase [Oscillospiraceae bacterium]|nr:M23 family metallopeptidase [Oscillospiraceae bacterium]